MATNSYGWTNPTTGNYGQGQRPMTPGGTGQFAASAMPMSNFGGAGDRGMAMDRSAPMTTSMGMGGNPRPNNAPPGYGAGGITTPGGAMSRASQGMMPGSNNLGQFMIPGNQSQGGNSNIPQLPQFNYQPQANPSQGLFEAGDMEDIENYRNQENSMMVDRYMNNYLSPMLNYGMQYNDQQFNQGMQQANFNAQQGMNQFNMGLQGRAANREDLAFNAGLMQDRRNFGENQYQYRDQAALSREQLAGQNAYQSGQIGIGQQQNANTAIANQNQYLLGQQQNNNTLYNYQNQLRLGQESNRNTATNNANQFSLGQAANANTRYSAEQQAAFNRGQLGLGQGRLNLDTRGQTLDDRFRYRDLAQQDQLARANMQNQLTQSRYQAFGRSQAPNFRAASSWA